MSAEPIHLFLNPTAGRGRAGRRAPHICKLLEKSGYSIDLHLSRGVGDLEAQVHEHVVGGTSHIIVAGGDGSVHEATNGILRAGNGAALGLIPTGTGNDFAKACNIPLDWEHATLLLGDRIAHAQPGRKVDVGIMNGRFFANGAGIGLDATVTRIARSYRLPIGDLVYLLAILRSMVDGIATPRMRLTAGTQVWDGPITLANVANGPWVGGMFHIAPMADNSDGAFDLMIAAPVSRLRILALLPTLMSGKHVDEQEISHTPVTDLLVEADQPVDSHLDGEMQARQQRFEISLVPGALHLL